MRELGEDKGRAGYLGGAVGVGGDVLERGPALSEQGERLSAEGEPSYARPVISSPQARAAADDGSVNRASRALATRAA
jgi:hypothetical protein